MFLTLLSSYCLALSEVVQNHRQVHIIPNTTSVHTMSCSILYKAMTLLGWRPVVATKYINMHFSNRWIDGKRWWNLSRSRQWKTTFVYGLLNDLSCALQMPRTLLTCKTFSMPIINAAATEWPTLITALDQLSKRNTVVSDVNSRLAVTLDMDLYKRVLKLEYLNPDFKMDGCSWHSPLLVFTNLVIQAWVGK